MTRKRHVKITSSLQSNSAILNFSVMLPALNIDLQKIDSLLITLERLHHGPSWSVWDTHKGNRRSKICTSYLNLSNVLKSNYFQPKMTRCVFFQYSCAFLSRGKHRTQNSRFILQASVIQLSAHNREEPYEWAMILTAKYFGAFISRKIIIAGVVKGSYFY